MRSQGTSETLRTGRPQDQRPAETSRAEHWRDARIPRPPGWLGAAQRTLWLADAQRARDRPRARLRWHRHTGCAHRGRRLEGANHQRTESQRLQHDLAGRNSRCAARATPESSHFLSARRAKLPPRRSDRFAALFAPNCRPECVRETSVVTEPNRWLD
jgi:hypothetical protein